MTAEHVTQPARPEWCPWDHRDRRYQGARQVVAEELATLRQRRPAADAHNLTGLALSGGGIRSASFSLGVMQALAHQGWLERFDYLSTVSGGGYIGTSLTWLLHKPWPYQHTADAPDSIEFGLGKDNFPFKTEPVWSLSAAQANTASGQADKPAAEPVRARDDSAIPAHVKGAMLRWIRQNGKFLTPGGCHNVAALSAVVIRGSLLSLAMYLSMLVLLFMFLDRLHAFTPVDWAFTRYAYDGTPAALVLAGWGVAAFALLAFAYSLSTYFTRLTAQEQSTPETKPVENRDRLCEGLPSDRYYWRRLIECALGWLLLSLCLLGSIGALPLLQQGIITLFDIDNDSLATLFSVVSSLVGIGAGLGVFAQSDTRTKSTWLPVLVISAATLLLLGVLLLAYQIVVVLMPGYTGWRQNLFIGVPIALLLIGWFSNLNYISVHRYYRDRLMETFMPDVADASIHTGSRPCASVAADRACIQAFSGHNGPYHLLNTNIVLVESPRPKFKGRGGDNFILSPHYCGSNATGWRRSDKFMNGGMTLATAMAISGAAVNPSTGCGGEGITRKPLLSLLMGLLNIRLGYWACNPDPAREPRYIGSPNFIWPGIGELILRRNLDENSRFIQLSDGGHFENLGLYELLRRRVKVIVVCDGGADPDFTFSDLANAIEKARADFGTLIKIDCNDLEPLVARARDPDCPDKFAVCGHLVADIHYAEDPDDDSPAKPGRNVGKLIYLTTTFTRGLSADLYGYRKEHPEFPDEPTSDQFFGEKQLEAYRELGFQLAWRMLEEQSKDLDSLASS